MNSGKNVENYDQNIFQRFVKNSDSEDSVALVNVYPSGMSAIGFLAYKLEMAILLVQN